MGMDMGMGMWDRALARAGLSAQAAGLPAAAACCSRALGRGALAAAPALAQACALAPAAWAARRAALRPNAWCSGALAACAAAGWLVSPGHGGPSWMGSAAESWALCSSLCMGLGVFACQLAVEALACARAGTDGGQSAALLEAAELSSQRSGPAAGSKGSRRL